MRKYGIASAVGSFALGFVMFMHGVVHAMGVLGAWELKSFDDISYQPNILLDDASDPVMRLLGVVWLVAGLAFVLAAIAFVRRMSGWPRMTLVAAVISLAICLLWVDDAIAGVIVNVAIIAGLAVRQVWLTWSTSHGHDVWPAT